MAEEVEDAFLFHQARDEIEDGLVVLRAVGALGMLVLAADLVVLELEFAEQGLDDLGHALLLEHAGVLVQGQEPQPRHHLAAVAGHLGFAASGIGHPARSEEHTSELQSLMRISYAVFCLKKKKRIKNNIHQYDLA